MLSQNALIAGRYRLVRLIASGGMGVVWEGWDERLRRAVAVKTLHVPGVVPGHPDVAEHAAQRALREARITARLHHPNAVAVFDVVDEDGLPCLVMEYLPSVTLAQEIAEHGPLPVPRVIAIGRQLAAALAAAHAAGIVHRDVKPANVLLDEAERAKITDFGIAHALGDVNLTSTGLITGTPAYLAPEVARGQESDGLSDVFSLGGTLYAAVEGHPPYGNDDNPMALLHRIASSRPTEPRNAGELAPLFDAMLSTDRSLRPSMRQVEQALSALSRRPDGSGTERTALFTRVIPNRGRGGQADAAPPPNASAPPADPAAETPAVPIPRIPIPLAASTPEHPPASGWPATAAEPVDDDDGRPEDDDGSRPPAAWMMRTAGAALVLILLTAGLIIWLATQRDSGGSGAQGAPPATPTSSDAPTSQPTAAAPSSTPTSAAATPPPAATPTTTAAAPTTAAPTTAAPATTAAGAPPQGAATPAQVIRNYYDVMPAGTDTGWRMLTSDYQRNHVQGRQAYEDFWGQIKDVAVSGIQETGPGAAPATITYDYYDGRRYVEVTQFTTADEGGVTKIASTTVVQSR